ncbi:CRISPR-associated endoribonuclease Cas6 [Halorussus salilacus]|uniref:CRISPR-associated endoribonuclease Cas6 n=1 Tax=Halorussus salilacus TaxID=2953750 RepID=UPI0020A15A84|nr:CRISPR-associated endoribonuclease Cas6 [Halorussus salilacus]USZ68374.1 CRISPR-associated endoribonuclease Cas6 [Halorussus salilacus]
MRLLVRLSARANAVYDEAYHHKLRGRLWNALEGTEFGESHDANVPSEFCYSNPFPPRDMDEGDRRTLLVASPHEELLSHVARDLKADREFNVGEMPFRVEDLSVLAPDVGEPGTSGVIETGTGVVVRIPQHRFEDYDIDPDGNAAAFWRPEYTTEPFRVQVRNNLDRKHGRFYPERPGPSDREGPLFDSRELIKTFALPVTVTTGEVMTYVLSKWRFEYTVRNDHHRRHLNLALDCGIGERNALGFGFLNIVEDEDG